MKRYRISKLLIGLIALFCIAGCQAQSLPQQSTPDKNLEATPVTYPYPYLEVTSMPLYPGPNDQQNDQLLTPVPPTDAPEPETGFASISGIVYSYTIGRVLPKTNFYLTHGFGPEDKDVPPAFIGPLDGKGDVQAMTDETGIFALNNIPPGNYYLVVEAPYNWSVMQVSIQDFTPKLLELKADQKYVLGIVYVSWP